MCWHDSIRAEAIKVLVARSFVILLIFQRQYEQNVINVIPFLQIRNVDSYIVA